MNIVIDQTYIFNKIDIFISLEMHLFIEKEKRCSSVIKAHTYILKLNKIEATLIKILQNKCFNK